MAVQSTFKNMLLCLLSVCLVCSALLAGVYELTKTPIEDASKNKTRKAIAEVVPAFDSLSDKKQIGADGKTYTYYAAYDADKNAVGYAIEAESAGFGGPIRLMVGINAADGTICNTSVLSMSETPGLGSKCKEEKFASQFRGFDPSLKKLAVTKDKGAIDAITASTITSRAYIKAVENALAAYKAIVSSDNR